MKRRIRNIVADVCRAAGILRYSERRNSGSLTVLCYHRVLPQAQKVRYFAPELVVTPEAFRAHCRMLREQFNVLPLSKAIDAWRAGEQCDRPLAAITFDDGYWDNAYFAAPILADFRLPATFFVVADFVGTAAVLWFDRLARAYAHLQRAHKTSDAWKAASDSGLDSASIGKLAGCRCAGELVSRAKALTSEQRNRLMDFMSAAAGLGGGEEQQDDRLMDWQQLAALANAGHEIGSHGLTHEILPQLDDHALESEVAESRRIIERRLDVPVRAFCYPNGDVDDRVVRAVQSAGYRSAVSVEPGVNEPACDPYRLKRWFINEDRLAGPSGRASDTLLRMEICSLADRIFRRRRRRAVPL